MASVFLHLYDSAGAEPQNVAREFLRLPVAGEHLSVSPTSELYEVKLVVHCPFEPGVGQYAAEVFAHKVKDSAKVRKIGVWRPHTPLSANFD